MKRTFLNFIIQLLIAAIVTLGLSQAGGDFCPPECSQCNFVTESPSCCEKMDTDKNSPSVFHKSKKGHECDHGGYCDAIDTPNDAIITHRLVGPDYDYIYHFVVTALTEQPLAHFFFSFESPPKRTHPPLYTLHCSFII